MHMVPHSVHWELNTGEAITSLTLVSYGFLVPKTQEEMGKVHPIFTNNQDSLLLLQEGPSTESLITQLARWGGGQFLDSYFQLVVCSKPPLRSLKRAIKRETAFLVLF